MDKPVFAPTRIVKQTISASDVRAGMNKRVPLKYLADEFGGSPAYLRALRIKGNVTLTADVSVNGYLNHKFIAQRALRNLRLVVCGHEFFRGIDGEDLAIDVANRSGYCHLDRSSFPALSTGSNVVPVDVLILLDEPGAADEQRHDCAIPVSVFNDEQESWLEFDVGTDLGTGTELNVTSGGSGGFNSGLEVHAYLVHRDKLVVPTPWELRSLETSETETVIRTKGGLVYLFNLNRATTLDRIDHTGTDWQQLTIDGKVLHTALTSDDYVQAANIERPNPDRDGSLDGIQWATTTVTTDSKWTGVPLYISGLGRRKTKLLRGDVGIKLGSMPAAYNNRARFLVRETGLEYREFSARVAKALGITNPDASRFDPKSKAGGGDAAARILPMKITTAQRTKFAAINAKAGLASR